MYLEKQTQQNRSNEDGGGEGGEEDGEGGRGQGGGSRAVVEAEEHAVVRTIRLASKAQKVASDARNL